MHLDWGLTWHANSVFTDVRSSFLPSSWTSCSIQVTYSNIHNPTSLSSPGATSAILHFECYNHKFPQKPVCCSDKQDLSWLCHKKTVVPTTNQPTNHRGFLQSFRGGRHRLHRHPQSVRRGEQKVFLHVRFLFALFLFPVPSLDFDLEMSDSFYLMWKKNTEINYLIFLML